MKRPTWITLTPSKPARAKACLTRLSSIVAVKSDAKHVEVSFDGIRFIQVKEQLDYLTSALELDDVLPAIGSEHLAPWSSLLLSVRTSNILDAFAGEGEVPLRTIRDLSHLRPDQIIERRNAGEHTLGEVEKALASVGLKLGSR